MISAWTEPGRRSEGSAVSESSMAPIGTERPPARAMTPFLPTMKPGVASAWIANSAVMVENAMPISTVRPSRARAPAMLNASDATDAIAATTLTRPKCSVAGIMKGRVPAATTIATGVSAASRVRAITSRDRVMARVVGTPEPTLTNSTARELVLTTL